MISQGSGENVSRLRVWETFAWLLIALILVTTFIPAQKTDWPEAAILVLLLSLASEWLVLKRTDKHQHADGHKRNAVRPITSLLLIISAVILAISSLRQ
jgi:hypothetical protein